MLGEYDYFVLARKHYTISLTMLSPAVNLRALYGLIYACRSVAADSSPSSTAKRGLVFRSFYDCGIVVISLYFLCCDRNLIVIDKWGLVGLVMTL